MSLVSKSVQPKSIFDPRLCGNCLGWWDGADSNVFTLSGNAVTQWRDKSSNLRHADVNFGAAPISPTRISNGVTFNGTTQGLRFSLTSAPFGNTTTGFTGETICIVGTFTGTTARSYCMIGPDRITGVGPGTRSFEVGRTTSNIIRIQRYGTGLGGSSNGPVTSNVRFLTTARFGLTPTSTRFNGTDPATTVAVTFSNASSIYTYIGCRSNTTTATHDLFYEGTINEIIMFNWINPAYLQAVEGYLANKWGISTNLPIAHPYRTTVPFFGQFNPRTSVPNCYAWFDGADESTFALSGSSITTWTCKIVSTRTLRPDTSPVAPAPVRVSNGVQFNGTSQYLRSTGLGGQPVFDGIQYYVVTFTGSATGFYTVHGTVDANGNSIGINRISSTSNVATWYQGTSATTGGASANGGNLSNVRFLIKASWSLSSVDGFIRSLANLDGSNLPAPGTTVTLTTGSTSNILIGARVLSGTTTRGNFFPGIIHEMLWFSNAYQVTNYDTNHTAPIQNMVTGYLSQKWGLTARTSANNPATNLTPYPGRVGLT